MPHFAPMSWVMVSLVVWLMVLSSMSSELSVSSCKFCISKTKKVPSSIKYCW